MLASTHVMSKGISRSSVQHFIHIHLRRQLPHKCQVNYRRANELNLKRIVKENWENTVINCSVFTRDNVPSLYSWMSTTLCGLNVAKCDDFDFTTTVHKCAVLFSFTRQFLSALLYRLSSHFPYRVMRLISRFRKNYIKIKQLSTITQ